MSCKSLVFIAAALAALLLGVHPAAAQHAGDILLTLPGGRIDTGRIGLDGTLTPGLRVFEVPFSTLTPGFTDTPGFDCVPGTFPIPSSNGFRLRNALRVWMNGNFYTPAVQTIGVTFGPLGPISTPPDDTIVTGFRLSVGSNGEWHRHLEYTLGPPQDDGIYLMEMSLFSTLTDVTESKPFWMVFGMNASPADLDTAASWVYHHLVCPADFNGDMAVSVQDIFDFLAAYFSNSPAANFNGVAGVTIQDIFDYLAAYFTGC